MARNIINIGANGNDGTGDSIRESFRKSNNNFAELYAVFGAGGQIKFTDLSDTPASYNLTDANKIVSLNDSGTAITIKSISGVNGILVSNTNDSIVISGVSAALSLDSSPKLGFHLNADNQIIGNLASPDDAAAYNAFINKWPGLNPDTIAIPKGYADSRYILAAGSSMSGPLRLYDHPTPYAGVSSSDPQALQAATKLYVDKQPLSSASATISFPTEGQTITFNGTEWVNSDAAYEALKLSYPREISFFGDVQGSITFDGSDNVAGPLIFTTPATSVWNADSTPSLVVRDSDGDFSAGIITATLNGTATNVSGIVDVANGGTGVSSVGDIKTLLGIDSILNNASLTGNVSIGTDTSSTVSINATTGTPTDTATPAGYLQVSINGTTAYIPYYI